MELAKVLKYKYPNLEAFQDYTVMDNGDGAFIAEWNATEPHPKEDELQAAWEEMQVNPPEQPISDFDILKKQLTDLTFDLMMKEVL